MSIDIGSGSSIVVVVNYYYGDGGGGYVAWCGKTRGNGMEVCVETTDWKSGRTTTLALWEDVYNE